jgi:uncharacterized linocin/CFP29 family protein
MSEVNKEEINSISNIISNEFSISGINSIISNDDLDTLEELKEYLTKKISNLIDNNFEKLINTLYRIDVNEDKLQLVFSNKDKKGLPEAIAGLIIERQLQKIEMRKKYKEGKI